MQNQQQRVLLQAQQTHKDKVGEMSKVGCTTTRDPLRLCKLTIAAENKRMREPPMENGRGFAGMPIINQKRLLCLDAYSTILQNDSRLASCNE